MYIRADRSSTGRRNYTSAPVVIAALAALVAGGFAWVGSSSSAGATTPSAASTQSLFPSSCSVPSFGTATNFPAGTRPFSAAVGDFNRDSNPDLAVTNFDSNNVSVLLGDGSGGFGNAKQFPVVGDSPRSVAVGDFNRDGNPDLATANQASLSVSVLLGEGDGGFSDATDYPVGDNSTSIAVGDFNRDGNPDLAVSNMESNSVSVLLGNGNGGFGTTLYFPVGSYPNSVAVGDFNRDGNPDLVVSDGNIWVLLGNGNGGFGTATSFPVLGTAWSAAVGDFNRDGNPDVATATLGTNNVSVLLGNGNGGFSDATYFAAGTYPNFVAVGDFNRDGNLDLAAANETSNNVSVLLGNGNGGFGNATNFMVGNRPNSVAVGDFNRDGNLDLAAANESSNNVSVLLNTCDVGTTTATPTNTLIPTTTTLPPTSTTQPPTSTSVPPTLTLPPATATAINTSTWTPSATPTATPSNSCSNYVVVPTSGAAIVPGSVDIGNHCDDCLTTIGLPFPVTLYGTEFTSARASSNGNLQFADQNVAWQNRCLPSGQPFYTTIFPYFDDLSTRGAAAGAGIFTGVSGSTPNRTFHIEWRACIRTPAPCSAVDTNFEVRLHEGTSTFEIVYGPMVQNGSGATVGVQRDSFGYTQFSCDSASLSPGMKLTFSGTGGTCPPTPAFTPSSTPTSVRWPNLTGVIQGPTCNPYILQLTTNCSGCINAGVGPTHMRLENSLGDYLDFPVPALGYSEPSSYTFNCQVGSCVPTSWFAALPFTLTVDYYNAAREPNETDNVSMLNGPPCATRTATATLTNTQTATATATFTNTSTATASPTACMIIFSDVPTTNTFHANIRCLACRGIISGYADGTFKPNNLVTRGQLAKIVSNAANFIEDPNPQIFEDVSPSNTFYQWINRLARRGHMSGYPCGGVGEPCITGMPYFRPFANATRGQTSKIVSNAAGYTEIPTEQTFEDVPPTHTFYNEIQRLASRNIMQGYPCGGVGEPCVSGRPYFRPANNVTRGQSSKIVANAFYPDCQTPARP